MGMGVGALYFVNDFKNCCKKYQNLSNNVKICQKVSNIVFYIG